MFYQLKILVDGKWIVPAGGNSLPERQAKQMRDTFRKEKTKVRVIPFSHGGLNGSTTNQARKYKEIF